MNKIISILKKRLEEGKASTLVTLVADHGSSPRSAGAMMVIGENGRIYGTIGGGMLEFRATKEAGEDLNKGQGTLREYRLTQDEKVGLGMACGGDVDVLFTVLVPTEENRQILGQFADVMFTHQGGYMVLSLDGQKMRYEMTASKNAKDYSQRLMNQGRVYVFGGGHLAQELVPVLAHLNYRCVVSDDRAEFATKELFPEAEEVHVCDFAKLSHEQFPVDEQDMVVIVTRGHLGDYQSEAFALGTKAYYIGCVGSRAKIAMVNGKLRDQGFTEEEIARVTTPIGLDIHSETPAEIAISIAAQMIKVRAEHQS